MTIHGYDLIRQDRESRRGGGVCIYLRNNISYFRIHETVTTSPKISSLLIELPVLRIFLLCLYIPPSCLTTELQELHTLTCNIFDRFLSDKPNFNFIVLGDLNNFDCSKLCSELDIVDIIVHPTRKGKILDHFLLTKYLNQYYSTKCVQFDSPVGRADHDLITVHPDVHVHGQSPNNVSEILHDVPVFDFRMSYINSLRTNLRNYDWSIMMAENDINTKWRIFHRTVLLVVDKTIPKKYVTMSSKDKEWLTPLTKLLINERWLAYRQGEWSKYQHLNQKVKQEIQNCKSIWADKIKSKQNGIWTLMSAMTQNNSASTFDSFINRNGGLEKTLSDLVNQFANSNPNSVSDLSIIDDGWTFIVEENDVENLLSKINPRKFSGDPHISSLLYKKLSEVITYPLTHIFQAAITVREIPTDWKKTVITPIPKEKPIQISRFRPVSQTLLPAKIFERIVLKNTKPIFTQLAGKYQHGFRSGCSTTTALVKIMNCLFENYDHMYGSLLLAFDLQKAFDTINHHVMIKKFFEMKVPAGLVLLIKNYLSDRNACVKLKNHYSRNFCISTGVPQGTVLSPYLFSAFFGDFSTLPLTASTVKFADDLTIILKINPDDTRDSVEAIVHKELKNINSWCESNDLCINVSKSKALLCSRKRFDFAPSFPIQLVNNITILGLTISSDLKWDDHVQLITKKANSRFYALRKLCPFLSPTELHMLYTGFVRPLLEYASPVFVGLNKKLSSKLIAVDKRAHRIIFRDGKRGCPCGVNELNERRIKISKKLYECIENDVDHIINDIIPNRLPRSNVPCIPLCRTDKAQGSFIVFIARLLNRL